MLLQSPKVNNYNFDHRILKPDLRLQVREREIEADRQQATRVPTTYKERL